MGDLYLHRWIDRRATWSRCCSGQILHCIYVSPQNQVSAPLYLFCLPSPEQNVLTTEDIGAIILSGLFKSCVSMSKFSVTEMPLEARDVRKFEFCSVLVWIVTKSLNGLSGFSERMLALTKIQGLGFQTRTTCTFSITLQETPNFTVFWLFCDTAGVVSNNATVEGWARSTWLRLRSLTVVSKGDDPGVPILSSVWRLVIVIITVFIH